MNDLHKCKDSPVHLDYFTWFKKYMPMDDDIFNCKNLRAEQRIFSKSFRIYDKMIELTHVKGGYVPAWLNIQENMTIDFLEKSDRCYLFPIADNIVASLLLCLEEYGFLKDPDDNFLLESPRITAHIRRIIQFFIIPSQLYDSKPCDVDFIIQKVKYALRSNFIVIIILAALEHCCRAERDEFYHERKKQN